LRFKEQWVLRRDDPARAMNGTPHGERWVDLLSSGYGQVRGASPSHFLFNFSGLGPTGFTRWLGIRRRFARGVNPLMATLDERNGGLEACLALSAIGLDGLGYQLALDSGATQSQARSESHASRFRRVAEEVKIDHGI